MPNEQAGRASGREDLVERIIGPLARRYGTATVLFHHAVAERLGLGPGDHKCLDVLLERGPMSGSQLAAITGLTSGAITGVVTRLERAGFVRREPDPSDRRKQRLTPVPEGMAQVRDLFQGLRPAGDDLLAGFDDRQLAAIAEFLDRGAAFAYERTAALRGSVLSGGRAQSPAERPPAGTAGGMTLTTTNGGTR